MTKYAVHIAFGLGLAILLGGCGLLLNVAPAGGTPLNQPSSYRAPTLTAVPPQPTELPRHWDNGAAYLVENAYEQYGMDMDVLLTDGCISGETSEAWDQGHALLLKGQSALTQVNYGLEVKRMELVKQVVAQYDCKITAKLWDQPIPLRGSLDYQPTDS